MPASPPNKLVGKTWAAMSTPFGWATAAITWAGRPDSASRYPTIHLRYPNVYVRFDSSTFARALDDWEDAAKWEAIENGVDADARMRGRSVIELAMAKKSADVLAAVFETEKNRLASFGWDRSSAVEPFAELFVGLCIGRQEVFALDSDQTPSALPIEFAAALADVLTRAGVPVLHSLVQRASETDIVQLIHTVAASPHKINLSLVSEDESKGTVLHLACARGYAGAVHALLTVGLDRDSCEEPLEVGAVDGFGRSPLELAVESGSVETVQVMLEAGCAVNQRMVRQAVLGDSVELAGLLVTRLSEGSVAAGEMLRGVLASLHETRDDPEAVARLERAAELLAAGGAPVDEETLEAAIHSGSGRVVGVLAAAAPGSVNLWEFGMRCVSELIAEMHVNHTKRAAIDTRCQEVAVEQQQVAETLWGKRAEIAQSMLAQKLEQIKLDLAAIPTAAQLMDREVVCAELLRGGQHAEKRQEAPARVVSPEVQEAENKLEQMLADQPPGWPVASRLGAVINIAKVHSRASGMQLLEQLATARLKSASSKASELEIKEPLDLGVKLCFLSHRSSARLPESEQAAAPRPEAVLELILAHSEPGQKHAALGRAVEQAVLCSMHTEPVVRPDVAAWHQALKVLLHGGSDPNFVNEESNTSALMYAIDHEDEATIALLVEHAEPVFQQKALDSLVDVLADHSIVDARPTNAAQGDVHDAASKAFFEIASSHQADDALAHMGAHGAALLERACATGDIPLITKLLDQGVSAVGTKGLLQTILGQMYHCSMQQQLDVASLLITANTDVNGADSQHKFPIQSAIELDNGPLLLVMLEAGADASVGNMLHFVLSKMLLNTRSSPKWELLQNMLDLLVEKQAEPVFHGPDGYFPLDVAHVLDDTQIQWLLKLAGADRAPEGGHPLHAMLMELISEEAPELGKANMQLGKADGEVWTHHADEHGPVWGTVKRSTNNWGAAKAGLIGRSEDDTPVKLEKLEVPLSKIQIISVKTMGQVLGNRPAVPVGQCSLKAWQNNNMKLLKQSLAQNPNGVVIEYTVDVRPGTAEDRPPGVVEVWGITEDHESLPVTMYTGRVRDLAHCEALAKLLTMRRREYLQGKCLSLISDSVAGAGLTKPKDASTTPLMMATKGGLSEIARALVKHGGGALGFQDVQEMLALLPQKGGAAKGSRQQTELVSELIADVVSNSNMDPKESNDLLETAITSCLVDTVEQLLKKEATQTAVQNNPYLHMTMDAMNKSDKALAEGFTHIIGFLLDFGADPNRVHLGKSPLALALVPGFDDTNLEIATRLIEAGAKFKDEHFVSMVAEWHECTELNKRCVLLEHAITTMIAQGQSFDVKLRSHPKTLLDIALAKNSGAILAILFDSSKEVISSGGADAERLLPPFSQLYVDLCTGACKLEDASTLKASLAETLTHVGAPIFHMLLDADPSGSTLLEEMRSTMDAIASGAVNESGRPAGDVYIAGCDQAGMTLLHKFASLNHLGGVETLLQLGAMLRQLTGDEHRGVEVEARDSSERTALSIAVGHGFAEMVKLLTDPKDEGGAGAVVTAELLYPAVLSGEVSMVQLLLEGDPENAAKVRGPFGRSVLHAAATRTKPGAAEIAHLLVNQYEVPIDERDTGGATALLLAIQAGNLEVSELLSKAGADFQIPDKQGHSAIGSALDGDEAMAHLALQMVNAPEAQGNLEGDEDIVLGALKSKNLPVLERVLHDPASSRNLYAGKPLLWWAAFFGHTDLVGSWAQANPDAVSFLSPTNGRSLLHYLAIWGNGHPVPVDSLVPMLLETCGAVEKQNPQTGDCETKELVALGDDFLDHFTPLSLAAKYGRTALVSDLLPRVVALHDGGEPRRAAQDAVLFSAENGYMDLSNRIAEAIGDAPGSVAAEDLFRDNEFRPSLMSLAPRQLLTRGFSEVEWMRCSCLCGKGDAVLVGSSWNPVQQLGMFGNPILWTFMSMITNPEQVKSLIRPGAQPGQYVVAVAWDGTTSEVTIDDLIPVTGAAFDPKAAFGSLGQQNEMWSHLYIKAMAKKAGSYAAVFALDTDRVSSLVSQLANSIVPGADPETLASFAPALAALEQAKKCGFYNDPEVSDAELVKAYVTEMLSGGAGARDALADSASSADEHKGNTLQAFQAQIEASDSGTLSFWCKGLMPEDLKLVMCDVNGLSSEHNFDEFLSVNEHDSPYIVTLQSAMDHAQLKELQIGVEEEEWFKIKFL